MSVIASHPRITPFLWFDNNAEPAVDFYTGIFPNSRTVEVFRNVEDSPAGKKGQVLTIAFELEGQSFTALNGGPHFKFTEAISFVVHCDNQQQIDDYWSKLTADGGAEVQCGWLKDKFGLSWQIVPVNITELIKPPKAMQAMLQMKKLIIADLEQAAAS